MSVFPVPLLTLGEVDVLPLPPLEELVLPLPLLEVVLLPGAPLLEVLLVGEPELACPVPHPASRMHEVSAIRSQDELIATRANALAPFQRQIVMVVHRGTALKIPIVFSRLPNLPETGMTRRKDKLELARCEYDSCFRRIVSLGDRSLQVKAHITLQVPFMFLGEHDSLSRLIDWRHSL